MTGEPSSDELTDRLLRAAGARVTAVDIEELGPEVTVARIGLATPAGPGHVTARLLDGLAMAITTAAPIRVTGAVMDRMAVPAGAGTAGAGRAGPMPEQTARDLAIDRRPWNEPRTLPPPPAWTSWGVGGSFTENAIASHWQDYSSAAEDGVAVLAAAVPQPEGFAFLAQQIYADDYHGADVVSAARSASPGGRGPRRAVPALQEDAGRPRAADRSGRPGRSRQSHRHGR